MAEYSSQLAVWKSDKVQHHLADQQGSRRVSHFIFAGHPTPSNDFCFLPVVNDIQTIWNTSLLGGRESRFHLFGALSWKLSGPARFSRLGFGWQWVEKIGVGWPIKIVWNSSVASSCTQQDKKLWYLLYCHCTVPHMGLEGVFSAFYLALLSHSLLFLYAFLSLPSSLCTPLPVCLLVVLSFPLWFVRTTSFLFFFLFRRNFAKMMKVMKFFHARWEPELVFVIRSLSLTWKLNILIHIYVCLASGESFWSAIMSRVDVMGLVCVFSWRAFLLESQDVVVTICNVWMFRLPTSSQTDNAFALVFSLWWSR